MRFAVSPEQQQFAASLHDLLTGADTPTVVRAWARGSHESGLKLLRGLAELGVPALLVAEQYGGLGADATDMVVVFEALGYHLAPGPLVETVVAAPTVLGGIGGDTPAQRWLPRLAGGEALATVVAAPHVPLALDADIADLVISLDGDATGEIQQPRTEFVRSVDPARRLFRVEGDTLPWRTDGAIAHRAFDLGVLGVAAQLIGVGQRLLDITTAYALQRKQYGRPIGQFQAIKHLLADVVTRIELARPLVHGAAVAARAGEVTLTRDVSAAKVAAGDAAYLAARTALQVHGAIGYTAEHDLGLGLTKVRALVGTWGNGQFHRTRVLEATSCSQ